MEMATGTLCEEGVHVQKHCISQLKLHNKTPQTGRLSTDIYVLTVWTLEVSGTSMVGLVTAFFLVVDGGSLTVSSQGRERLSLVIRTLWDQGSTLMPSFTLITFLEAPSLNTAMLGLRATMCTFSEDTNIKSLSPCR